MNKWAIRNKELGVILPEPYRYDCCTGATIGREEIIALGRDREARAALGRKLEVVLISDVEV